jgi:hypothetical protein
MAVFHHLTQHIFNIHFNITLPDMSRKRPLPFRFSEWTLVFIFIYFRCFSLLFTAQSLTQEYRERKVGWSKNYEPIHIWKEAVVTRTKYCSTYFIMYKSSEM